MLAPILHIALSREVLEFELLVTVNGIQALESAQECGLSGLVLADHRGYGVYINPAGIVNGFEVGYPELERVSWFLLNMA